jgi:hypothetical protein
MQSAVHKDVLDGLDMGFSARARRILTGYKALIIFAEETVTEYNLV